MGMRELLLLAVFKVGVWIFVGWLAIRLDRAMGTDKRRDDDDDDD